MRLPFPFLTLAFAVMALPASASELLPPGAVGCVSLKTAKQYAAYTTSAPNFAKDMLDRATCYINDKQAEVVRLSESNGFVQYKLLSGHKIWVPAATGTTPMPQPAQ
jgi:hypothetical protein